MKNCSNSNFDRCYEEKRSTDRTIVLNEFQGVEKLGKGSFAFVYLVKWSRHPQRFFALKIARKRQLMKNNAFLFLFRERNILQCSSHPNIVQLFASFKDEGNLYLILEYLNGGTLFALLQISQRFSDEQTKFYIGQIILAFEYLHCCRIIYRDLKPENLMFNERGYIKLIDFGFAKRTWKETETVCGTLQYLSPELIRHEKYDKCVDFWALGILTYEMLFGQPPFDEETEEQLFQAILTKSVEFPKRFFNDSSQNFIERLLTRNRTERLGCSSINSFDVREHFWFQTNIYSFDQLKDQLVRAIFIPSNSIDYSKFPLKSLEPAPITSPIDEKIFEKF